MLGKAPRKRILVCGPRDFPSFWFVNVVVVNLRVEFWGEYDISIVHGGAPGADLMADRAARGQGIRREAFPADWSKGKSAGFQRNIEMLDSVVDDTEVDLVVSIGYGRGTGHTIVEAGKRGIEVRQKAGWWYGKSAR